jgi:3-dehydroquinate synthase
MARSQFSSQLVFLDRLPEVAQAAQPAKRARGSSRASSPVSFDPTNTLLIFDRRLPEFSREFKAWSAKYPFRYAVTSGEGLKSIDTFPTHVKKLNDLARDLSPRSMTVVAVGGGSVGDFAGFFASVYKRGVRLVHFPTTWLAAIDSSHGGKTALNVGGAKNQIGTFYPASQVVLIKSLLATQPAERAEEAMGELGKIALIDGGAWVKKLERSRRSDGEMIWEFLKPAIESKLKVVERDPQELKGERQVLNLGHTVGHVLEAEFGWAHGRSVAQGLFFALEFSEHSGLLPEKITDRAMKLLSGRMGLKPEAPKRKLTAARFTDLILKDKKRSASGQVTFIFLKGFGQTVRASVTIEDLLQEARRQGLVGLR